MITKIKRPLPLLVATLVLLLLVGWGISEVNNVLTRGHELLGLSVNATMPFGLWMSLYIYFVGLSAGSVIISAATHVFGIEKYKKIAKMALLQAVALLAVALFFIIFDIGHPERAIEIFQTPNLRSPLAWVVWLYSAYFLLCVGYLWFGEIGHRPRLSRVFGSVAIPLAVSVHGGLGVIFAVVKARPFWNTSLLPVMFLTSALLSGVALLIVTLAIASRITYVEEYRNAIPDLGRLLLFFIAFEVLFLFLFSEAIVVGYGNIPGAMDALAALTAGPLALQFWGIQILLGAVIPLAILFHPRLRTSVSAVVFASVLVTAGIMAVRYNFVIAGLVPPLLPGLPIGTYVPTVTEWTVALGWFALAALIVVWGTVLLPILPEKDKAFRMKVLRKVLDEYGEAKEGLRVKVEDARKELKDLESEG